MASCFRIKRRMCNSTRASTTTCSWCRTSRRDVRHQEHVVVLARVELHIRRLIRKQLAIGIIDGDYDRVGDNILRHLGVVALLEDLPFEDAIGESVDGELDVLIDKN